MLQNLICLNSTRERYINNEMNLINGDKIKYEFESIEYSLEKNLILGKRPLEENQIEFIFSNEVFSGERNNLINDFKKAYPQEKLKNFDKIKEQLNEKEEEKEENKNIYYILQYIMIYLLSYDKKFAHTQEQKEELKKLSMEDLVEIIKNKGFCEKEIDFFNNNKDISLNNIIDLYELVELEFFPQLSEHFFYVYGVNKINLEEDELKNAFEGKEIIPNAFKKYILRYCLGDYKKEDDIKINCNIDKFFGRADVWDEKIFNDKEFKNEIEELKTKKKKNNQLLDILVNYIKGENGEIPEEPIEKLEEEEKSHGNDEEDDSDDVDVHKNKKKKKYKKKKDSDDDDEKDNDKSNDKDNDENNNIDEDGDGEKDDEDDDDDNQKPSRRV